MSFCTAALARESYREQQKGYSIDNLERGGDEYSSIQGPTQPFAEFTSQANIIYIVHNHIQLHMSNYRTVGPSGSFTVNMHDFNSKQGDH